MPDDKFMRPCETGEAGPSTSAVRFEDRPAELTAAPMRRPPKCQDLNNYSGLAKSTSSTLSQPMAAHEAQQGTNSNIPQLLDKGKATAPQVDCRKDYEDEELIAAYKDKLALEDMTKEEAITRWSAVGFRWTQGEPLQGKKIHKGARVADSLLYTGGIIDIGQIEGVPGHYVYVRPKHPKADDLQTGTDGGMDMDDTDEGDGDAVEVPLDFQRLPHTAQEMIELARKVTEMEAGRRQDVSQYPHGPLRLQFRPSAPSQAEREEPQRHQLGWLPSGKEEDTRPANTDVSLGPANRLTERVIRRIFDYYTEAHMKEALPEVPLMPAEIDHGPLNNSRLTNAEKLAYKQATLRKRLYDLGRMCRSWWNGCSRGYRDVVIIGVKDAERASRNICAWVPVHELFRINLVLQMPPVCIHRVLRALIAQLPKSDHKIELNRLTILHSYAPESFPPGCGTTLSNFVDQLERLEVRELVFEAYSGERVVDVHCLDVIADAMRRPWLRPRQIVWHAEIATDLEEALINAPGGIMHRSHIGENIAAVQRERARLEAQEREKASRETQKRSAAAGRYQQSDVEPDARIQGRGVPLAIRASRVAPNALQALSPPDHEATNLQSSMPPTAAISQHGTSQSTSRAVPAAAQQTAEHESVSFSLTNGPSNKSKSTAGSDGSRSIAVGVKRKFEPDTGDDPEGRPGRRTMPDPQDDVVHIIECPPTPGTAASHYTSMPSSTSVEQRGASFRDSTAAGAAAIALVGELHVQYTYGSPSRPTNAVKTPTQRSTAVEEETLNMPLRSGGKADIRSTVRRATAAHCGQDDRRIARHAHTRDHRGTRRSSPNSAQAATGQEIIGYVYTIETLQPQLPWPHLEKLDPAERFRREMWSDLFGMMSNEYRRWTDISTDPLAKTSTKDVKDAGRIARGWVPQNPLGNQMMSCMLKQWHVSLEKVEIRCAWSDLHPDIKRCAKNGKLEQFDYHFVPVNRKAPKKALTKNQQRRHHIAPTPPVGSLKSLDNILMWDFRFRPEKWFRQFVRHQLRIKYPDPNDPRGIWEEPAPTSSLYWTVHVPHDNWIQQIGRHHFKGLARADPWTGTEADINKALATFLTLEGNSKYDPGVQAELEGWTDREYFQNMFEFLSGAGRVKTAVGEEKQDRIGDDPLAIAAQLVQDSQPTLHDITGGATVDTEWLKRHLVEQERKQARKREVIAHMEERKANDPNHKQRRQKVMAEMMKAHVEAMDVQAKEELFAVLKKKYGARQLFRTLNWPIKTAGYPCVTLVVEKETE